MNGWIGVICISVDAKGTSVHVKHARFLTDRASDKIQTLLTDWRTIFERACSSCWSRLGLIRKPEPRTNRNNAHVRNIQRGRWIYGAPSWRGRGEMWAKARARNMYGVEREGGGMKERGLEGRKRLFSALRRLCQRYYTADSQGRALVTLASGKKGRTRLGRIDHRSGFLKYG